MSSMNMLPSAPSYNEAQPLYPQMKLPRSMQKTSGSKRSLTCLRSCLMKPSTIGTWPRNTNEATPLCTNQRLVLVLFPSDCHLVH